MSRQLLILLAAVLLSATPVVPAEPSLDEFLQSFTDRWMRYNIDQAAASRYFQGAEEDAIERQIAPRTRAHREIGVRILRDDERRLRTFDRKALTAEQRLSADIVAWDLRNRIEGAAYADYNFPLHQNGAVVGLPQLMTVTHPLATPRDAENYTARLAHVAPRMDETIVEAQRTLKKGLTPPSFILEASLAVVRAFLADPPAKNPLVASSAERMTSIKGLDASTQRDLLAQAETITAQQIYPAWKKAQALLESTLSKATADAGLWRFKDGAKVYAHRLRQYTTTTMSADEIHATGLRMVPRSRPRLTRCCGEPDSPREVRPHGRNNSGPASLTTKGQRRSPIARPISMSRFETLNAGRRNSSTACRGPLSSPNPIRRSWASARRATPLRPPTDRAQASSNTPRQPEGPRAVAARFITRPCPAITSKSPCRSRAPCCPASARKRSGSLTLPSPKGPLRRAARGRIRLV